MTTIHRAARAALAAVAAVLALTAGGCDDEPVGANGSIQVTVNPAGLVVEQGGSDSVTASLTRGGGFTGVVTLAIAGLPAGVTATITPAQLTGTTANATIHVTVAPTVAVGNYTATITATAQGVDQATTTYPLSVTALPAYALTVAPAALTIVAGGSGGATIGINRTNFTGGVALTVLNPPSGIAGSFNRTPSTTNEAQLTVSVAANVGPGAYPLTIRGTASGPGIKNATLTVTVAARPTGGATVEYRYCDRAQTPVFFAYQDGTGAWLAVNGSTSGDTTRFAFNLTQARGGVLAVFETPTSAGGDAPTVGRMINVRQPGIPRSSLRDRRRTRFGAAAGGASTLGRLLSADAYLTEVLYASTTELAQDGIDNCALTQPTKIVTGNVAGVPTDAFGIVSFGNTVEIFIGGTSTNPVTFDVPPGPNDLVGSRLITPGTAPDRIVLFRDLNVPDGGVLPSLIDFNGPASSAPATANVTITGAAGDDLEVYTDLVTANGRELGVWFDLAPSQATTRPWAGLGPAVMRSGDFHGLTVFAGEPGASADFRASLKYVGPVANENIALGPRINAPATSQLSAGAYPRFRFQGTLPAEYDKGASIDLLDAEGSGNVFSIVATGTYLAGSGSALAYDFTMPDVSGLFGFPAAARLTAGTNDVALGAWGFNGTGIVDPQPSLGGLFKAASRTVTISVP